MKKVIASLMVVLVMVMSSGCSRETVPQGTKGKILDSSGFHPEIYPPSLVDVGMHGHLVLVETISHTVNETVTVRMKDNMNLIVQVRFKLRMGEKAKSLNFVFNDVKPKDGKTITLDEVYELHGKALVNKAVREVLSTYNLNEVNVNFNHISSDIYKKTLSMFKPTPLIVTDVSLGKLTFPKIIDDAIEAAAKRELEIKQAEADVQVRLTELKGKEQVAKGEYRIKMQEAKRIRDYNKMVADGISEKLLSLRKLEVQEKMVEAIKENKNVIYMPMEMMNSTTNMRVIK